MNCRWESGALVDLEDAAVFYFNKDPVLEDRFLSDSSNFSMTSNRKKRPLFQTASLV